MKKRLLSILLLCCMLLSLLPTAYAEGGTAAIVNTAEELTAALSGDADIVKLTKDIEIAGGLNINRKVTLNLNDHVLTLTGTAGFITVSGRDTKVTLTDSAEKKTERKFSINQASPRRCPQKV